MALFKFREDYLETRILDFDPNNDDQSKRSRHRSRGGTSKCPITLKCKENMAPFGSVDHDAQMQLLKKKCYHEIDPTQVYKVRPVVLRQEVRQHVKRMLAQMMVLNALGSMPPLLKDCCPLSQLMK